MAEEEKKFTAQTNEKSQEFNGASHEGNAGEMTGTGKPANTGAFKAKEHEEPEEEKGPGYTPFVWGEEKNVSDWLVNIFSGRLQDWFIANLKAVDFYSTKLLNKADKWLSNIEEREALHPGKDKDGKDKDKGKDKNKDKAKDGKDKGKKDKAKDGKDKGNKDKGGKEVKTSAQERNDHKAQKAQETLKKAQKNMANRRYDNSDLGKNQKAFDQMTVESLKHEAAYRKNVAANPGYANSPEGRAARAELVNDRKTLSAMQKETGVNNKIVDGKISKKTKAQKAVQRAKIGLKVAGAAAKEQKGKIAKKVKQAQQKGMKKLKQKTNIKNLSNLKSQLKNMMRQKTNTQSRQQGKTIAVAASKKRAATR